MSEDRTNSAYQIGDTLIWMDSEVVVRSVKWDAGSETFKYEASSLHDDVSVNERYWISETDLSRPTFGDIPDDVQDELVLDPMGPEIQSLFY